MPDPHSQSVVPPSSPEVWPWHSSVLIALAVLSVLMLAITYWRRWQHHRRPLRPGGL